MEEKVQSSSLFLSAALAFGMGAIAIRLFAAMEWAMLSVAMFAISCGLLLIYIILDAKGH